MRIKDPKKKIFKEDPVLSMDKYRNVFEGKIDCPLYAVYPEGKHFCIMYWDTCEIATADTLEEARQKIWKNVTMFDPKLSEELKMKMLSDCSGECCVCSCGV